MLDQFVDAILAELPAVNASGPGCFRNGIVESEFTPVETAAIDALLSCNPELFADSVSAEIESGTGLVPPLHDAECFLFNEDGEVGDAAVHYFAWLSEVPVPEGLLEEVAALAARCAPGLMLLDLLLVDGVDLPQGDDAAPIHRALAMASDAQCLQDAASDPGFQLALGSYLRSIGGSDGRALDGQPSAAAIELVGCVNPVEFVDQLLGIAGVQIRPPSQECLANITTVERLATMLAAERDRFEALIVQAPGCFTDKEHDELAGLTAGR